MSLVIHTIVRDGIVVCADTRATLKDGKGHVAYDDTAEKIMPFPNRIVVSYCGDADMRRDLTVTRFLCEFRKKYGNMASITDLPLQLLNEYKRQKGLGHTTFNVSGCIGTSLTLSYTVSTAEQSVVLKTEMGAYGAFYDGCTDIAQAIMSGITYDTLSFPNAIKLTRGCLLENIEVYKYRPQQSIGGKCQTYVIDTINDVAGWYQEDGSIVPDVNAPSDAHDKIVHRRRRKREREMEKQEAKEKGE